MVTNAGGPAALATDLLIASGGQLATLAAETSNKLDAILPAAWSHGNPIDMLGRPVRTFIIRRSSWRWMIPAATAVLAILTPQAMTDPAGTAERLAALAAKATKPLLASWMGAASLEVARAKLNDAGIPTYDYPDAAARAFALMWRYSDNLRMLYERPPCSARVLKPARIAAPPST
jgi:acetyltransferase